MTKLHTANSDLLKRQEETKRHQPRPIAAVAQDAVTAVANSPLQPPHKPETNGRVIERTKLSDLKTAGNVILSGAIEVVYKWRDRKQDGYPEASLLLVGPVGTGKTHIARAMLWSMCYTTEDGKPVAPIGRFYVGSDLMLAMTPARTDSGIVEIPRPRDFLGNIPILVIDDVGTEQAIPYVAADDQEAEIQARYFRVIDYCYQWRISIVMTSNLSLRQLEDYLGPRSWDRLSEMAPKGFMYDMTGVPSWRKRQSGRGANV